MTIQLKPEQERAIGAAIQAGLIRTADDVVDVGLEAIQRQLDARDASPTSMSREQWLEEFRAWVHSHSTATTPLSDQAISREFIYGTRGQ